VAVTFPQAPSVVTSGQSGTTAARAFGSAVQAGDLLFAFVGQRHATNTVTGVSDSVNGAWTYAFGPVRAAGNLAPQYLYGYYRPNSAAGTPTVTATFSAAADGGQICIGVVRGLAGGGALDQVVSGIAAGPQQSGWPIGTSATLAQAEEAAVAYLAMTSGAGTSLWTDDAAPDSYWFERMQRIVTTTTAAQAVGTSGSVGSAQNAIGGAMFFKDGAGGGSASLPPPQSLLERLPALRMR
jgi:hypothetical protein